MKTVTNIDRSKVMKAAWSFFRKNAVSFSEALKSAWGWAKKTILAMSQPSWKKWSPSVYMTRFYLGADFIQFKTYKGVATVTLSGCTVEQFEEMFCIFSKEISGVHTFELNGINYDYSFAK